MTAHTMTNVRRARVGAAIVGTAAVLLGACSPSEPAPPTLDEALDAADALLSNREGLEDVLVEPRPGRGSAQFTFIPTQSARDFVIKCISSGHLTVRLDGEEKFSDECEDTMLGVGAYGVAGENDNIVGTLSESVVEVEAADDVYWVAALYTHSNGRTD